MAAQHVVNTFTHMIKDIYRQADDLKNELEEDFYPFKYTLQTIVNSFLGHLSSSMILI